MTLVLGCDPGLKGAIALLRDTDLLGVWDIPTLEVTRNGGKRSQVDHVMLAHLFADLTRGRGDNGLLDPIQRVYIEDVGVRPGEGAVGAFAFGKGFGALIQAVADRGLPYTPIAPRTWQIAVGLKSGSDDDALDMARRLWPSLHGPDGKFAFGLKKHAGRADAALIALAGVRRQA